MFYHTLLLKDVLSQGHSALHPEQVALCNTIAPLQHSVMAFHRHASLHDQNSKNLDTSREEEVKAGVVKGL